jgi:hypothetical protein
LQPGLATHKTDSWKRIPSKSAVTRNRGCVRNVFDWKSRFISFGNNEMAAEGN